jgi:1,4-dihydroxy-2-naphthoyl-CoA hydrolase
VNRRSEADPDPAGEGEFLRSVGLRFDVLTGTEVRAHLDASEQHHTPWGMVHGGLYTTVIETAASVGASHAVRGDGKFAVGVNNQTDFLRPHVAGRLDVRATPLQQGRTLQLWLVEITNGDGRTVARGQVRLMNRPLPSDHRAAAERPARPDPN